jgi:hypothetical protein
MVTVDEAIFSQTVCVLLDSCPTLDQVAAVLSDYDITGRNDGSEAWEFSGPALIIAYRPEVNGYAVLDLVDRARPDDMGFENDNALLHSAWKAGQFGQYVFPGSLERAAEQSWGWAEGKEVAAKAKAFIRVRFSYVLGKEDDDGEWLPEDYDSIAELEFATAMISKLLTLPQALCYFNPGGEVLRDQNTLEESIELCAEHEIPTVDLWANVRLFRFDDDWAMMDTVGNGQLGVVDVEACFNADVYDFNGVDQLLRTVSMYLVGGEEFEEGEMIEDDEGLSWKITIHGDSLCDPPREVLRLLPDDGRTPPAELTEDPSDE